MTRKLSDWRNDDGLESSIEYKKHFALFPKTCTDGTKVWLKNYYTKYEIWGWSGRNRVFNDEDNLHTDKIEDIPEDTYIVRKLTEGF